MIRLRRIIECGLRHPVFGPLLLLVVVALVVFVALHGATDTLAGEAPLVCVAIVMVLLAALLVTSEFLIARSILLGQRIPRGPPSPGARLLPATRCVAFHPLRL